MAPVSILTETVLSPTLADQLQSLLKRFPKAKWHQYEPANRDNVRLGARLAFGEGVEPQYHFERCETILSLDTNFFFKVPDAFVMRGISSSGAACATATPR